MDEGDCRLRSFDLNFRRIRCGIMVGMEGVQEKPTLGLVNVSCKPPSRCVAMLFLADIVLASAEAAPTRR